MSYHLLTFVNSDNILSVLEFMILFVRDVRKEREKV